MENDRKLNIPNTKEEFLLFFFCGDSRTSTCRNVQTYSGRAKHVGTAVGSLEEAMKRWERWTD